MLVSVMRTMTNWSNAYGRDTMAVRQSTTNYVLGQSVYMSAYRPHAGREATESVGAGRRYSQLLASSIGQGVPLYGHFAFLDSVSTSYRIQEHRARFRATSKP